MANTFKSKTFDGSSNTNLLTDLTNTLGQIKALTAKNATAIEAGENAIPFSTEFTFSSLF